MGDLGAARARRPRAQTLAQKAIAAGIAGEQVDGNDVIAVRHAMDQALAKARAGGGPTLIEALTYRLSDHTTADDATRYRSADELAEAWKREPLSRLRTYLTASGAWDKAREEALAQGMQRAGAGRGAGLPRHAAAAAGRDVRASLRARFRPRSKRSAPRCETLMRAGARQLPPAQRHPTQV